MGRSRFVSPDSTVLHISNGDTLTVRKRLNQGERRAMFARMYQAGLDGNLHTNPLESGRAIVIAHLLDWSLCGDDGSLVPIAGLSPDELGRVLDSLDPDDFTEIKAAIEAHTEQMEAERKAERNPTKPNGAEATSPSPFGAAGASSGSVN